MPGSWRLSILLSPELAEGDFRRTLPRFQTETVSANQRTVAELHSLAAEKNLTTQLALFGSWFRISISFRLRASSITNT